MAKTQQLWSYSVIEGLQQDDALASLSCAKINTNVLLVSAISYRVCVREKVQKKEKPASAKNNSKHKPMDSP